VRKRLSLLVAAVVGLLAVAQTALAGGSSSLDAYGGAAGVQGKVTHPGTLGTVSSQGTLPFTGVDIAIFVVIGLVLVAAGLMLRRAGRRAGT
jgi:hypothetical protein